MSILVTLGALGGIGTFLTLIFVVGRGIFRQVAATEDNTKVLIELTAKVEAMLEKLNAQDIRLAVLEDRLRPESPHGHS